MTIKDFMNGLPETKSQDGKALKDVMAETTHVWNNNICRGYCLAALKDSGLDGESIKTVMNELSQKFGELTEEEAEALYTEYFYS